jgi:hypothetical protein
MSMRREACLTCSNGVVVLVGVDRSRTRERKNIENTGTLKMRNAGTQALAAENGQEEGAAASVG